MTEKQKEALMFKDYPEGSVNKEIYDSVFLPFHEYLNKYYINPDLTSWERWKSRYIEPAFNKNRHDEMIKNFGYVDKKYYDFDSQNKLYEQLKNDERIDGDIKQFMAFMAGTGFFKKNNLTLDLWFAMKNWANPYVPSEDGMTINEILNYKYGDNLLRTNLPILNYWRR